MIPVRALGTLLVLDFDWTVIETNAGRAPKTEILRKELEKGSPVREEWSAKAAP